MRTRTGTIAVQIASLLAVVVGCAAEPSRDVHVLPFKADRDRLSAVVDFRTVVPEESEAYYADNVGLRHGNEGRAVRSEYFVVDYGRSADGRWRPTSVRSGSGNEARAEWDRTRPVTTVGNLQRTAAAADPAWRAAVEHAAAFVRANSPAGKSSGDYGWAAMATADRRWVVLYCFGERMIPDHMRLADVEYPWEDLFVFGVDAPAGRAFDPQSWHAGAYNVDDVRVGSARGRLVLLYTAAPPRSAMVVVTPFDGRVRRSPANFVSTADPISWDPDAGRATACSGGSGLELTDWWYDQDRVTIRTLDPKGLFDLSGDDVRAKPIAGR